MQILLRNDPNSGYDWDYYIENESVVSVMDDGIGNGEAPGLEDERVIELIGISEGESEVKLLYRLGIEDENPKYEIVLTLSVDSENEVAIDDMEGDIEQIL